MPPMSRDGRQRVDFRCAPPRASQPARSLTKPRPKPLEPLAHVDPFFIGIPQPRVEAHEGDVHGEDLQVDLRAPERHRARFRFPYHMRAGTPTPARRSDPSLRTDARIERSTRSRRARARLVVAWTQRDMARDLATLARVPFDGGVMHTYFPATEGSWRA